MTPDQLRNKRYHDIMLIEYDQQNKNDYSHRMKYEIFSYHLLNGDSARKEYCKKFSITQIPLI